MRVREIHIERFRNLRDVHIGVPDDARLICLVGKNGTGKRSILKLIAAAIGRLGERPIPSHRPSPLAPG